MSSVRGSPAARPSQPQVQTFDFGPWTLTVSKSHILESTCRQPEVCEAIEGGTSHSLCSVCRYGRQLSLPGLPEMCFPENTLRIQHTAGYGLEFNALDALKRVNDHEDLIKVACANEWKSSRGDVPHINSVSRPFDWTFTTDYRGTLLGHQKLAPQPTDDRIDMEKLKQKEKIMFYEDILLFEDELADHGCAICNVKVRVMPRSFFLLLRFYLRVDGVLVRVNDTRLYHEADQAYMLREYTSRQSLASDLKVPLAVMNNPNEIWMHLPVTDSCYEKLRFPGAT
ncbi:TIP41-like protein [Amphibalanus amphitrite]|uniref:TIP41-like protein n=1 Tax=Amphibalanus amphitrite TaxID=1232801 RepID=A0A6A4WNG0_AMPAM|nr:TIP41-like protein [Amphibalanus amphitrite]XP_043221588.1 TIP41-like protein [Amphibalanus amphitrite]XP_043221589.1 TIP41-like protein [Amphibalanus amphitrite]XP_043240639.1 TIP41-like protein [Amphibalanus amphitrite]XP_043240640.1 TIP41-like protein [Amphibalanus amphitrite]XP_043240641.1 TIP41-like protein [Amphibalanus amphitrite]XP_043240642.1 TIP41-like protein [Amphibalanus amphitrite]XP_043240643.1 TIP41-like protein [Amphibalanus amphitrite]XP_043240644.1 TIP41-like protein [